MNIIEAVRQILTDCDLITQFTNEIHVDFTNDEATNFGISSNGDVMVKEDILGNQTRKHNFVLYAVKQSYEDFDRLANSTFLLDLTYYLETIKGADITAMVNGIEKNGKLLSISSANAMLYSIPTGEINDGITYQLQIYATYSIESEA